VSVPNGTVDSFPAPSVKLDSTGPRVVSIDPPNNANSVAPNSAVTITFTEKLDAATVTSGRFRIIASDDSQAAPVAIATETLSDGQFRVRLTPTVLLKSNLTYTLSISDSITDASGNKMTLPVTTNFTTVDYTEPRIEGTLPSIAQAIGDGTTFYLLFNKAIDASVFASGGSGLLKLEQLGSQPRRGGRVPVADLRSSSIRRAPRRWCWRRCVIGGEKVERLQRGLDVRRRERVACADRGRRLRGRHVSCGVTERLPRISMSPEVAFIVLASDIDASEGHIHETDG
jgi:hypothetical protein